MYTFMPPASPDPGCSIGEVCRERKATRRISDILYPSSLCARNCISIKHYS